MDKSNKGNNQMLATYFSNSSENLSILHYYYFNGIPNRYKMYNFYIDNLNFNKLKDKLISLGYTHINEKWYYYCGKKVEKDKKECISSYCFKHKIFKILISIAAYDVTITYSTLDLFENEIKKNLIPLFNKYNIEVKKKPVLKMLIRSSNGVQAAEFDTKIQELDLDNYNDDFINANEKISSFMEDENRSGLVLLHGLPGTGKTSYIRSLISKYREQTFIYIPNDMIDIIVGPDFLPIIAAYPKSILILEDCERLLKSRDNNETTMGISNILNITDGLLSDCLKMKIIATFNCDENKIDEALRRPGRLVYEYEFTYLMQDKVKKLFKKYKIKSGVNKDKQYVLADIYSDSETGFNISNKSLVESKLGFDIPKV